jgi:dTDP-glucose 4,6-dehydratase
VTRRILVTGGAGFIGSNFARHLLATDPGVLITNLDLLTYAGVQATVDELDADERHTFVHGDIADADLVNDLVPGHDAVVNFAAESHVDRSIDSPAPFLHSNVLGAGVLLDAARRHGVPRFVQVSTDEVYGSLESGAAGESAPLRPSSPYSASKAAADLLAAAYATTFDYRPIVTRCTNNFGPYQHPEKAIPRFITALLDGEGIPVYGDGLHQRDWLFVEDHCRALALLLDEGEPGEIYNIGADQHLTTLELARRVCAVVGVEDSMIEQVADRPGHDRRYAVDSSRIRAIGWAPSADLGDHLTRTVEWYRSRRDWWEPLIGGTQ